jgi:hypothetical protein
MRRKPSSDSFDGSSNNLGDEAVTPVPGPGGGLGNSNRSIQPTTG